jgi:hypothetical protein
MAIQKSTISTIKSTILTATISILFGAVIGSSVMYQYLTLDHFKIYKTNIGLMVFVKDKIYNLSEMRSLDQ